MLRNFTCDNGRSNTYHVNKNKRFNATFHGFRVSLATTAEARHVMTTRTYVSCYDNRHVSLLHNFTCDNGRGNTYHEYKNKRFNATFHGFRVSPATTAEARHGMTTRTCDSS